MATEYRTIQGDTWDSIAFKITGNEKNMTLLINANPGFEHIVIFDGGIVLQVPEIDTGYSVDTLPPWKLVDA